MKSEIIALLALALFYITYQLTLAAHEKLQPAEAARAQRARETAARSSRQAQGLIAKQARFSKTQAIADLLSRNRKEQPATLATTTTAFVASSAPAFFPKAKAAPSMHLPRSIKKQQLAESLAAIPTIETKCEPIAFSFEGKNYPATYAEMPGYVEENLADKITLLPSAVASLKDAQYEDVALVYQVLDLLATEYRALRMKDPTAEISQARFTAGLKKLGVSLTNKKYSNNLTRNKVDLLKCHIKKGVSINKTYCLRVYFEFDAVSKKVVISRLPAHG